MDDMSAVPLTAKEVAANAAALKLQEAAKNPKAVTAVKKAQESSITVVPKQGYAKGGKVRGCGCAVKGKTKGTMR